MTKLNDYNVTLHLRVKDNPRKWIVDCLFDTLNDRLGEDILYCCLLYTSPSPRD